MSAPSPPADEPEIVFRERVFPAAPRPPQVVPLSILDNTVVRFSVTCATWIYDPPTVESAKRATAPGHLLASFKQTIGSYPQWAGQLCWNSYDTTNSTGHTHRHGRVALRFGGGKEQGDPGIGFCVVQHPAAVSDIVPTPTERATQGNGMWHIDSQLPSKDLLPRESVAWQDDVHFQGLPGVAVQITTFVDGGYAVSVKVCHALADATTLLTFMHDWTRTNRAMAAGDTALPALAPVFHPSLWTAKQRETLTHLNPTWGSFTTPARSHCIDTAYLSAAPHVPGIPIPWKEWNLEVPVKHTILYFSPREIHQIHAEASETGPNQHQRLSKLDALLAHLWACILRARELSDDESAFLDITFSFRPRLGLPPSFLGSPIRLTGVKMDAVHARQNDLPVLACAIRSTIDRFDMQACAEILHDLAHEPTAQNIWATFLGRHHTLVTSWTKLGLYGIDFVGGRHGLPQAPRYVDATMPPCDGLLQISESAPLDGLVRSPLDDNDWTKNGASVSLHLRVDVMKRLSKDPLLRPSVAR